MLLDRCGMSQSFLVAYLTVPGNYRQTSDLVDQFFILGGIQGHFSAMIHWFLSGLYHANISRVTAPLLRLPIHPWRDILDRQRWNRRRCSPLRPIPGNGHKSQTLLQLPIRGQIMADAQLSVSNSPELATSASGTVACSQAHVSTSPRQAVYRYALLVIPCKRQMGKKEPFSVQPHRARTVKAA